MQDLKEIRLDSSTTPMMENKIFVRRQLTAMELNTLLCLPQRISGKESSYFSTTMEMENCTKTTKTSIHLSNRQRNPDFVR